MAMLNFLNDSDYVHLPVFLKDKKAVRVLHEPLYYAGIMPALKIVIFLL
jgi:predicted SPOUT superfamily RNA methylase MTH1